MNTRGSKSKYSPDHSILIHQQLESLKEESHEGARWEEVLEGATGTRSLRGAGHDKPIEARQEEQPREKEGEGSTSKKASISTRCRGVHGTKHSKDASMHCLR